MQSVDRVRDELLRGKDDLAEWATRRFSRGFVTTDHPDVLVVYGQIMAWAQSQTQFMDAARAAFARADCADGWLVACAKARGFVVVTHETHSPEARKRVLIPNVCTAFGVDYVDTWTMLRALGSRVV